MLNYDQILKFVKLVFDQAEVQRPAAKVLKAVLLARSPRLTDIGRKLSSNPETGKKYVQRFLARTTPQEALRRLVLPQAPFVLGDVTAVARPQAKKTPYVGKLKDGRRGFWRFVLSCPYRGWAIPFGFSVFSVYSSKTIGDGAGSRNLEHLERVNRLKQLISDRVLVLDREFSYGELFEALTRSQFKFVIRLNLGSRPPVILDEAGDRVSLSLTPGQQVSYRNVRYQGKVRLNLAGRWEKGSDEPLWVVTNIDPEEGLRIYELRMKREEVFKDLKSLLGLEKVMNKTVENLAKVLGLLFLAYAAGLVAGELLREKVLSPKGKPLYSGLFVLLNADGRLRKTLRSQAEALDELFRALTGCPVPTHVPT